MPPPSPLIPMCEQQIALMFVLDRSGSMSGEESGVVTFATSILDQLNIVPGHSQAGVVLFNGNGLTTQSLSFDRANIEGDINDYGTVYSTTGGTNIGGGLLQAKEELDQVSATVYHRIAVVLTDGEQNSQ